MNFGSKLKQLREAAGLTQRDLDRAADWNSQSISDCERGRRPPPDAATVRAVAAAVGVPPNELLALAARERGLIERPPDLSDARWAELSARWVDEAEDARDPPD